MIAIVTGASSGMGAEFCRALDREGLDGIWLVARRAERLERVAAELKTPYLIFSTDLSTAEGLDVLRREIADRDPDIRYLVNCAGFGRFGRSWEIPAGETRSMIDLNAGALTEVTDMCIPHMAPGAGIIELCSASAYISLEGLNVYAATKAYVRSYTNGLRAELKPMGINVLEVSPGWVDTDFIGLCRSEHDVPDRVFKHLLRKEDVVSKSMEALRRGKKRCVPGLFYRMQVSMSMHFPNLAQRVWSGMMR